MTKSITKNRYIKLEDILEFCRDELPQVMAIAYHLNDASNPCWHLLSNKNDMRHLGVSWDQEFISVHGFEKQVALSEVVIEDSNIWEEGYRQNPKALWEFYVWDSTCCIYISDQETGAGAG